LLLLQLLDEVQGMGQHDLVNRLMERDEAQNFSCDGVHFYNTVEEMEMAWVEEQTRPTLPAQHEPYIVPPELVKRRDYHVEPMCFPITDTPLALVSACCLLPTALAALCIELTTFVSAVGTQQ
jgi:hypothetical protein